MAGVVSAMKTKQTEGTEVYWFFKFFFYIAGLEKWLFYVTFEGSKGASHIDIYGKNIPCIGKGNHKYLNHGLI